MELNSNLRLHLDKVLNAIAAADAGPTEADLAAAPVLNRWCPLISPHGYLILWGMVTDHPLLGDDYVTTSQVFSLDAAAGWARTVSRWYRLAQPFAAFEAELIASMGMQSDGPHAMTIELPGFQPVSELERIPELLAASRHRIMEIDAIDRARHAAAHERC